MSSKWLPQIDQKKCTGCAECVSICPTQALSLSGRKAILVHPDNCNYCAICETTCPTQAIVLPYLVCFKSATAQDKET